MIITLKNNIEVRVTGETEDTIQMTKCYGCGKEIAFGITSRGKAMPISKLGDGSWVSHFFDCPKAKNFRKK